MHWGTPDWWHAFPMRFGKELNKVMIKIKVKLPHGQMKAISW
jgi:hypothetical protein